MAFDERKMTAVSCYERVCFCRKSHFGKRQIIPIDKQRTGNVQGWCGYRCSRELNQVKKVGYLFPIKRKSWAEKNILVFGKDSVIKGHAASARKNQIDDFAGRAERIEQA